MPSAWDNPSAGFAAYAIKRDANNKTIATGDDVLCPHCHNEGFKPDMRVNVSDLNWRCFRCGTGFDALFLSGWNQGFKAASAK